MEDVPQQMRVAPRVIDFRAKQTPDRTFAYLPKGDAIEDGFYAFTYAALARAVDALAWWLDETFDKQDTTIPYIGENDIRYGLVVFAAVKTGRAAMVPLLYNTLEGQMKLLNTYHCKAVVASAGHEKYWQAALDAIPGLRLVQIPSVETLLNASTKPYPYEKNLSEVIGDAMVILQTSGTTGNPKPLQWSNRWMIENIARSAHSRASPPDQWFGMEASLHECWTPNMVPLSWGYGLCNLIMFPLVNENIVIMFPSAMPHPISAENAHKMIQIGPKGPKNGAVFVPDTLKDMVKNPQHLESLKRYPWVGYVGAPLDFDVGDILANQGNRVQSVLGQMDCGGYPMLVSHHDDWKLYRMIDFQGFHMEKFSEDSWELCVTRQPDEDRPAFLLNKGIDVYHTKDLWKKSPDHEGYWMMAGRIDDFVKLANMTKFSALEMEAVIERNPGVNKVIVAGNTRERAFVLLQPTEELRTTCGGDDEKIVQQIQPQLDEVNSHVHRDAWLTKELVLVTRPDRPIERTAKGTPQRRSALAAYEQEIEEMYKGAAAST